MEQELGKGRFKVVLTISGQENKYAQWLYKKFGSVSSIEFAGFMSREKLFGYYHAVDCLVFPSKVETWGLPVSEFMATGKPMLLADLPYAHETAAGSMQTAFLNCRTRFN
ncbi:glycosyltransferase [Bacteroides thetaiotaomicron]|nr:glycosyltransferase [Bacteroides thetaiotaomicron]